MSKVQDQLDALRALHADPDKPPPDTLTYIRHHYDGQWQRLSDVQLMELIRRVRAKLGGDR